MSNEQITITVRTWLEDNHYKASYLEGALGLKTRSVSSRLNNHIEWTGTDRIRLFRKGILKKADL
jgi:hypothetical protein